MKSGEVFEIRRTGRYLVSRELGPQGGVAVIKRVLASAADPRAAAERLHHEHDLLASLDLPGVVRPLGWQSDPTTPALLMEDAGTRNLGARLRGKPMSLDEFFAVAIPLTELLARLHARNVIHRDISPGNVVLDDQGRLTLVDFGGAVVVGPERLAGVAPHPEGDPPYLAPEQTGRMNRLVDRRADLYSLGATFYEMLTGVPPFRAEDPMDLVHAHLAQAPLPLDRVNSNVPAILSDVVLRLLAKMPERRYQSAEGLVADLHEAAGRLKPSGEITRFELGLEDLARELPLPPRLYGRDGELAQLSGVWARVSAGATEAIVIAGEPGVGKSALAMALGEIVVQQGGHFARGKPDPRQSSVPFGPLLEAFRGLLDEVNDGPPELAARLRERITTALGTNTGVLTELLPELENLVGPAERPPVLGPGETQNRFRLVLASFVQSLTSPEQPLVLFIDDLQWVDTATLDLIHFLLHRPGLSHLLILCACREGEGADQVARAIGEGEARAVTMVSLPVLDADSVLALCCDVLRAAPERCLSLAGMLVARSRGNPFFVRKLLRHLQQSGLLARDPGAGEWSWDAERISEVGITDNVADFLAETLGRLPPVTRRMLLVGACIGVRFEPALAAEIAGEPLDTATAALWTATVEGHLLAERGAFRFSHDRIQQAAYAQPGEPRADIHARIGRVLLAGKGARELERQLFVVADQLNLGAPSLDDRLERVRAAELSWQAAKRARTSSAWGPAQQYLERARRLLPDDSWETHQDLTWEIHRDATEVALLASEGEEVSRLFDQTLKMARTAAERADLCGARTQALNSQGQWKESLRWAAEGLRHLGILLPSDFATAGVREMELAERNLAGRSEGDLLAMRRVSSREVEAAMKLLSAVHMSSYFSDRDQWLYAVALMMNLMLQHGHSAASPISYVDFAVAVRLRHEDFARAYELGRLGVKLGGQMGDISAECRSISVFAATLAYWREPIGDTFPLLRQIRGPAAAAGELMHAGACTLTPVLLLYHRGAPLDRLLAEIDAGTDFVRNAAVAVELTRLLAVRQAARFFLGQSRSRACVEPEGELCVHGVLWLGVAYLMGDLRAASDVMDHVTLRAVTRSVEEVDLIYYSALTLSACHESAASAERTAIIETVQGHLRRLRVWADNCPENYRHKEHLVAAELARLTGRSLDAADLYDRAAECAARNRFLQDEGLANELAGRFHRAAGRDSFAHLYLAASVDAFRRWGARAKVEALEEEFPELSATRFQHVLRGGDVGDATVDLVALFRAAEALSGEMVLSRLCGKLIEVCVAAAGAERGALVLSEEGGLFVRALGPSSEPTTLRHDPLARSTLVPIQVVEQVRRMGESLVVGDALAHEHFKHDPYVVAQGVRSMLALPIIHQGTLLGVLYLENNLATRVFAPARVRLLQLLSSQIAISLQNSQLFEDLTREVEERRRAEAAVRFLADAGASLSETLDYQDTLGKLPALALPTLGDWCLVYALESGAIRRVASAQVDPGKQELLAALESGPDGLRIGERVAEVVRSGAPLLLEAVRLGASGMVLPLVARGRSVGGLALISVDARRPFGTRELALGQELARRAAVAIDNARLYREAREAISVRDEFMSIASHELNTPLTSLQLMVDVLSEESAGGGVQLLPKAVPIISRQSQRLRSLVNDLLDVTNIRRGSLPLRLDEVDLAAVVRETVERFGADLARAGCAVNVQAPAHLLGRWDRARLEQVVTNLLSNATKFAAGKPIDIIVSEREDSARLEVADQGMGIPADRLAHVFGRFERAVPAQKYGGLGLGLYIVHEIVRSLGGKVSVESVVHAGSRFVVELPRSGIA